MYMKHSFVFCFFFTVKPTLLNINILHPNISAVPSAQASPGPHALSSYTQSVSRPGPKLLFPLHTQIFLHQFCLFSSLPTLYVCLRLWGFFVFWGFFGHPVPQKSSCEVQELKSLFSYQLPIEKEINKFIIVRTVLFSWIPFLCLKKRSGAVLLDSPEETHCKDHGKELRKERENIVNKQNFDSNLLNFDLCERECEQPFC